MTQPNNDQPEPAEQPVTEVEQMQRLRALMIKRMLEAASDPDIKASGLAVIAKFLSEAGVIAPPVPPQPIPAGKLPFGPDAQQAPTTSKLPFPPEAQPGEWKALDHQPFITP